VQESNRRMGAAVSFLAGLEATMEGWGASNLCCLRGDPESCAVCTLPSRCRTLNDSWTRLRVSEDSFEQIDAEQSVFDVRDAEFAGGDGSWECARGAGGASA
jgi:hypothetical protein